MALFEVFIPTVDPNGFNITARIRADSWINALRNGLSRLGDTADVKNVMCDFNETGIDVTEPHSGRVFRIRELAEAAAPAAPGAAVPAPPAASPMSPPAAVGAPPPVVGAVPPPAAAATVRPGVPPAAAPPAAPVQPSPAVLTSAPAAVPMQPPPAALTSGPAALPIQPPRAAPAPAPVAASMQSPPAAPRAAPPAAPRQPPPAAATMASPPAVRAAPPPAVHAAPPAAASARAPAGQPQAAPVMLGRFRASPDVQEESVQQQKAGKGPQEHIGRVKDTGPSVEELLEDLFDKTQAIYEQPNLRAAAGFILDLAMRTIPSESGSVFIADINHNDLYFAAAAGPKADEVMNFRVPMGQGIVGFSAQEGVSLAVSDVQRHPAFYAKISQSLGYETRSILCSPAQDEGRVFGALELINKPAGPGSSTSYTNHEVDILNYLAHQFADYLVSTGQTGG